MAATLCPGGGASPISLSRTIERSFEEAEHTGIINLNGRKLREFPKIAWSRKYDLADTITADLSRNRFSEIPAKVCEYTSLEKLNCYHNVIKCIPDALIQLEGLTFLNLSRNQLSVIPPFISRLKALEVLIASHNRLVSLPEEIGVLDKLLELDVSCNEISQLPPQMGDLKSLKSLDVRRNLLLELPVEISKLNLRRLDFSSNKISKIPTVFQKIKTIEEIILDYNPLTVPPAHICMRGRQHIMKYLETEASKEDRKLNMLNESEMKRFVRKSLPSMPSGQSISSEEFRNIIESPERLKRHTVLSRDSGYSTTESVEKCDWSAQEVRVCLSIMDEASSLALKAAEAVKEQRHGREMDLNRRAVQERSPIIDSKLKWSSNIPSPQGPPKSLPTPSPTSPNAPSNHLEDAFSRELQRQRSDIERQKKQAEQIRLQHEEKEREERRKAALHVQEEQRALLEKQREEARRNMEEVQYREDMRVKEEQRERERQLEEAKLRAEEEVRQAEKIQQQEVEHRQKETKKSGPPARGERKGKVAQLVSSFTHDEFLNHSEDSVVDYYGMYYRKQTGSQSFKEERHASGTSNSTTYRRTVSDSAKRMQSFHSNKSAAHQNGISEDGHSSSGSSTPLASPGISPNTSNNSLPSSPSHHPPGSRTNSSEKNSPQHTTGMARRTKPPDKTGAGRGTSTIDRHGRASTSSTTGRASTSGTNRKNHITPEEEFKIRHQAIKTTQQQEAQRIKSRLTQPNSRAGQGVSSPRTGTSGDGDRKTLARNNMYNTAANKRGGTVLSASTMKILEEYKDTNPNFTIRRHHEQQREEVEQIEHLKKTIEVRLKITLPENVPAALRDGVVLCHLVNQIRPRAVASIHVPSPAVPKLTLAKCRRNVENFLEACRKIGVNQEQVCGSADVLEERGTSRVAITVAALIAIAANPKQSAV
ncbi:hypothetical protein ScPMuIL_017650 [Solemya velum]